MPASITHRVGNPANLTPAQVDANFDSLNSAKQDVLVSGSNIKTINGGTILAGGDLALQTAAPALNTQSGTTYSVQTSDLGKDLVFSNASGCAVTIPASLGAGFTCNFTKTASAGSLTFVAASTTLTTEAGSLVMSAPNGAGSIVPIGTDIYILTGPFGSLPGSVLDLNPTDITATRALTSADFDLGILRINSAGVSAITIPTVAAMSLSATTGRVRRLAFMVVGAGTPTFAGATSSTSLNSTAGTATVLPGSNAGVGGTAIGTHGLILLIQEAVGSNNWSLT